MDLSNLFRIDTNMQLLLFAFQSKSLKPLLVQYIHSRKLDENEVRKELKAFISQCDKSIALKNFKLGEPACNEAIADLAINTISKKGGLFDLLAHSVPLVNRIKSLHKKISKGVLEKIIENIQCTENELDLQSTYNMLTTHVKLSSSERVLLVLIFDGSSISVSEMIGEEVSFAEIFLIAVICGSVSILDSLWNHKENSEQTKWHLISSNNELTALHFAVLTGNMNVIDWLLQKDFLLEAVNENGDTGLHLAASAGHKDVVEMLINYGSSCDACNANKKTPLHKAAGRGHGEIVDVLIKNKANIEEQNASGNTPLIEAVEKGHRDVVEQLLNHGAAIYTRNFKENSCLHRAAFHGYSEIAKLLLSRGIENIAAQNCDGKTPLHIAAERGHLQIVALLLEKNADIHSRNKFGQTPLHEASWKGHAHIVEFLLKCGASGQITDFKNRTALHEAAWNGHIAIVELLCHVSDVNAVDKNEDTALSLAEKFGKTAIVEFLRKKDAN